MYIDIVSGNIPYSSSKYRGWNSVLIEVIFRNTSRRLNSQQQCVGDPEKILKQSADRLYKSIYAELFLIFFIKRR